MDQLQNLLELLGYLMGGAGVTLGVTFIALGCGFLLGMLMAVLRIYGGRVFSTIAATYSLVVRGVPIVVTIFILYFVIARFVDLSPFMAGALALGFASGAYQSEVLRGAILSVPRGQLVAARAIGMSRLKAIRHIVLPQALRIAIPAWSNEVTLVIKDSSLVYVIGVPEILRRAQYFSSQTLQAFLAFGAAAAIYLVLTFLASRGLEGMERRYKIVM
jgi:polar amino acid transport system permease protein